MSIQPIQAVIFDMDGILIDSEGVWQQVRIDFAQDVGKVWNPDDQRLVMGGSTFNWATVMKDRLELDWTIDSIIHDVKSRVRVAYETHLPLLPGAIESVHLAAKHYKTAVASGSETSLLEFVMQTTGLDNVLDTVVYGDTVPHGKPAPDIYLEALRRLNVAPSQAVGIEDSANGIRSLKAAGMKIIAVPGHLFPLSDDVLALADVTLKSLEEFSVELVESL